MTLTDVLENLARRRALIVHFSHHAVMREGVVFPSDLQEAIANKDDWPLSTCVLWPAHPMDLPGDVGIIFRLTNLDQVLTVDSGDSGAGLLPDGSQYSGGVALTSEALAQTFEVAPGGYNEWRIKGAEVAGIYVASPDGVYAKTLQPLFIDDVHVTDDIGAGWIPIAMVRDAFPNLPLFTMGEDGPVQV